MVTSTSGKRTGSLFWLQQVDTVQGNGAEALGLPCIPRGSVGLQNWGAFSSDRDNSPVSAVAHEYVGHSYPRGGSLPLFWNLGLLPGSRALGRGIHPYL